MIFEDRSADWPGWLDCGCKCRSSAFPVISSGRPALDPVKASFSDKDQHLGTSRVLGCFRPIGGSCHFPSSCVHERPSIFKGHYERCSCCGSLLPGKRISWGGRMAIQYGRGNSALMTGQVLSRADVQGLRRSASSAML